jgi:uncharacterized protein YfaA (DUF2138 family)
VDRVSVSPAADTLFDTSGDGQPEDTNAYASKLMKHDGAHNIQWLSFLMEELGYSVSGDQAPIMY